MNRDFIKKLMFHLSRPVPFKCLRQLSRQNFIFPFYHLVSDNPSPLVKHLYPVVHEKQFRKDLDFLLKYYLPASQEEVFAYARDGRVNDPPKFFLSFDDGFTECYTVVAPILKEKGLSAAFFVNPVFIGNKKLSHRQKVSLIIDTVIKLRNNELNEKAGEIIGHKIQNQDDLIGCLKKITKADSEKLKNIAAVFNLDYQKNLHAYKPYMDISQLMQLKNERFIIGSHSFNHPEFNLLTEDEMKSQVIDSFQFLEKELNIKERIFSFPFHDIGIPDSFFNFLQDEMGVRVSFGTSGIKRDQARGHLQRIPLELNGFSGADAIIRSEYFYYLGKALIGKNLVKRK